MKGSSLEDNTLSNVSVKIMIVIDRDSLDKIRIYEPILIII